MLTSRHGMLARTLTAAVSATVILFPLFVPRGASATWLIGDTRETIDGPPPAEVLARRREALLEKLKPGIAFIRSAAVRPQHHHPQDSDFRQDNNFYYLTGLETPDSWLLMYKTAVGSSEIVLYSPSPDPGAAVWRGVQPDLGELGRRAGVAKVRPASRFETEVVARLRRGGADVPARVYLPLGDRVQGFESIVQAALEGRRSIHDLGGPLRALRQVKDSVELARLRKAVALTVEAQRRAMQVTRPGMHEYELEAVVEYTFRAGGAERVGFPTIVGSGPNSVVLHHDTNRRRMQAGDLVVIDAGAEYGYYTADVTRTFPVTGRFTPRQRAIYELVLKVQAAVIDSIRPGITTWEMEGIARRFMREHSKGLCGKSTCDRYFTHGLSHWLGMDVHDVGDYKAPLAPGMVLTVEPGVYLEEENLGIRIEDDVLVTENGHEVLSAGAPREVEAIEALVGTAAPPYGGR